MVLSLQNFHQFVIQIKFLFTDSDGLRNPEFSNKIR